MHVFTVKKKKKLDLFLERHYILLRNKPYCINLPISINFEIPVSILPGHDVVILLK